jgi:hypothetical protein
VNKDTERTTIGDTGPDRQAEDEMPWPRTSGGPLGCLLGCLIGFFAGAASVLFLGHQISFLAAVFIVGQMGYYPICASVVVGALFGTIGWFIGKRFYREYPPPRVRGGANEREGPFREVH